jgi:hypothetical protein
MNKTTREACQGAAAAGVGAVVIGGASAIVGTMGLAVGGSAIAISLVPMAVVGAGVGVAGWGVYKLGQRSARAKPASKSDCSPFLAPHHTLGPEFLRRAASIVAPAALVLRGGSGSCYDSRPSYRRS